MIYFAFAVYTATVFLCGYRTGEWKMEDRMTGKRRTLLDVLSWRFLLGIALGVVLVLAAQMGYWMALAMIHGRV